MICANCGTENEPGTKFCDECGAVLAAACPNCGSSNRPNAKFCATCGTALGEMQPAGEGARVAGDGQPAIRGGTQAERALVSVLFVDLVGFTPFAEERDPEQVRETLDRYFGIARLAIERHGGTIEKFIGDAVMAVWGTPVAHEDDAERAVRAALELIDAVHELGPGIDARGGIMTGEAAVTVGAEGQGMVAGDLVNTASRLQSVAPAGAVLVGEATMRASEAAISFEPIGEQELKGKSAPVSAFRATRVVANRGGQSRSESLEAPFVGREEELRQLKDLLHASSRDPRVRLVSIIGPAGIGKSRLTWEFEKYVDGLVETIFWHRGRSPAYGEGVTFWALGEMVRRRAELTETDDEATTRTRIHASVAEFVEDVEERDWIESALLTLLGVQPAPSGGRDALFAAWRLYLERIAARGTTALVFEDLQWADDGLLDFIEHVLEWSKNLPLLVITLSRPELFDRRPGWASGQRFMTALALEPLKDEHMRELLAGLAPGLPDNTVNEILRRADGIPLYAVEIVRMLVADGKLELVDGAYRATMEMGDLAVPETLRSLIASRLDAIDPTDRGLLQDASVLGQRFTLAALVAVSRASGEGLEARLRSLARREFLDMEQDPRSPERGQYGFVQSLIREVAYSTLSKRDRRERHLAAARYFEALGDEELAGALATHYLAAHEASTEGSERDAVGVQARLALRAAAERAAALGAHEQAVSFLQQALAVTADPGERAALLEMQADSANSIGADELAERSVHEALEIHRGSGDEAGAMRASALYGRVLIDQARLPDAIAALEEALARRPSAPDDLATASALATLSRAYMRSNERERSVEVADRALAVAERDNADSTVAEAFLNKGSSLNSLGRWREGKILVNAAVQLADEVGAIEVALRGRNNLSVSLMGVDVEEAVDVVRSGIELARRMGQRQTLNWQTGSIAMYLHVMGEDWDEALGYLDDALSGTLTGHDRARLMGIRALLQVLRGDDGAAAIADARSAGSDRPEVQTAGTLAWAEAQLALFDGRTADCRAAVLQAAEYWRPFEDEVYPLAARAALFAGEREIAEEVLGRLDALAGSSAYDLAVNLWSRAARAAVEGSLTDAGVHWRAAADAYRDVHAHFPEAETLLDLVTLTPRVPDTEQLADRARQIFERIGAKPFLALLDDAVASSKAQPTRSRSSESEAGRVRA